jgi:IS30 family transposase
MSMYHQLSEPERYTIAYCMKRGFSKGEIARMLNRHPSTIYREIKRNITHHDGWYRALIANSYAVARRRRERRGSQFSEEQWAEVIEFLKQEYSPEQIAGTLKVNKIFSISHETIYQYIIKDKRRGGTLYEHLRNKLKRHRKRAATHERRMRYADKRPISERPESVERRSRIGHWEGDTVLGSDRRHCILTLVERKTGFTIIRKINSRTVSEVNKACIKAVRSHQRKFRSITFDNGVEFGGYNEIEKQCSIKCYFANPYHSWERGSNENLNGLIRQYLPKGTSMKEVTQKDCNKIANNLNSRPRKRHRYRTPKELFYDN